MPKRTFRAAMFMVSQSPWRPCALLGVALLLLPHALAQSNGYPPVRPDDGIDSNSVSNRNTDPAVNTSPDRMSPDFRRDTMLRREAARKVERKKRMVDSANRLLELAQQLRAELATREPTPDDAKRLDEIAKLARVVRDQMRD